MAYSFVAVVFVILVFFLIFKKIHLTLFRIRRNWVTKPSPSNVSLLTLTEILTVLSHCYKISMPYVVPVKSYGNLSKTTSQKKPVVPVKL